MQDVALLITSPLGITNYEFTESGLLRALQQFLTVPPSQSYKEVCFEEEVKQSDKTMKTQSSDQITKKDSKCLIMRLKVFAHVMCHEIGPNQTKKLPFIALIAQCHSVLSVNEPILFSKDTKDNTSTVDALKQLNRHCVINLVYDPDRKNIFKSKKKPAAPTDKEDPLKEALGNEEMLEEESIEVDELGKSPVLDRKAKSSLPFEHMSAAPKEEKSLIYYRRHKLFTELGQVPLNI